MSDSHVASSIDSRRPPEARPGVVHHPVDPAPAADGGVDERLEVGGRRHVRPLHQHVATRVLQRGLGRGQPLLVTAADGDRRALGGELAGEGEAQPVGAARDEHDLAGQLEIHGSFLLRHGGRPHADQRSCSVGRIRISLTATRRGCVTA